MPTSAKTLALSIVGLLCWTLSGAQTAFNNGIFSASLESNSIGYINDSGLGAVIPDDRFGSNNYLKMDYNAGNFSAGMQLEGYLPALYGFEIGQQADPKKLFLASKYIRWSSERLSIHLGDIYDQFGNGLIFRSYEDRNLGFNNSLEGIQLAYSFTDWLSLRGMYGRPRLYTDYLDSWVRGADLNLSISGIFGWKQLLLDLEGAFVSRYEDLGTDLNNVNLFSASANFAWKGLTLKGEYALKSQDFAAFSEAEAHRGAAIYAEAIYSRKAFSGSATFRIIDHMGTMLSLQGTGTGNTLNYLPSLTRQYHYMLPNLNPYQVNVVGEAAGQLDLFYTLRSKSSRSKYWVFHANASTAWTISGKQSADGLKRMMWGDVNADAECHWGRNLKTTFLYSRQQWNPSLGYVDGDYVSNIFVADVQYKFSRRHALRGEMQYLQSKDYEGDWVAGLLEMTIAPHWNIYVSDMYNAGLTHQHYYTAGASWSKGATRIQLSYGRNRAGYVCSGGVCRYTPAYTGLNLMLTSSF